MVQPVHGNLFDKLHGGVDLGSVCLNKTVESRNVT